MNNILNDSMIPADLHSEGNQTNGIDSSTILGTDNTEKEILQAKYRQSTNI